MKWTIITPLLLMAINVAAQMPSPASYFNSSSNSPAIPSSLSPDYHLRHYELQQPGQKEASSNIYDTIDRYILERNMDLQNPERYRLPRRFIYHAPLNSVDNENQRVNNNGNGNLNNTNSYRP